MVSTIPMLAKIRTNLAKFGKRRFAFLDLSSAFRIVSTQCCSHAAYVPASVAAVACGVEVRSGVCWMSLALVRPTRNALRLTSRKTAAPSHQHPSLGSLLSAFAGLRWIGRNALSARRKRSQANGYVLVACIRHSCTPRVGNLCLSTHRGPYVISRRSFLRGFSASFVSSLGVRARVPFGSSACGGQRGSRPSVFVACLVSSPGVDASSCGIFQHESQVAATSGGLGGRFTQRPGRRSPAVAHFLRRRAHDSDASVSADGVG